MSPKKIKNNQNFNPRSLTGASECWRTELARHEFQSTLPYGSDLILLIKIIIICQFQSTLPYGSDEVITNHRMSIEISIHAPLRERLRTVQWYTYRCYFNPRSLTGARIRCKADWYYVIFQSTLPYGSDTPDFMQEREQARISIHAPLRERYRYRIAV